jgi:HlyD family secretion protein
MPARISLDAFPDRDFPGHVRRIAPYVLDQEKQARTVEIEAEIDAPDKTGLLPGYSADVEVILDHRDGVLRVPTSVVDDEGYVFVFDPDTSRISQTPIVTGLSNWEFTEITEGLREGDRVVSSIDRDGVVDGAVVTPE